MANLEDAYIHVINMCSLSVLLQVTVALSLPVAIINQPMFTSNVATCEMHGMYHPAFHSNYATEQQLYL